MTDPRFLDSIEEQTESLDVGLLICNAGISNMGKFLDKPLESHLRVLDLNARSPLVLTHRFACRMVAKGKHGWKQLGIKDIKRYVGGIILMSSMSCLHGSPYCAQYASTKAYNMLLAESLWGELQDKGLHV